MTTIPTAAKGLVIILEEEDIKGGLADMMKYMGSHSELLELQQAFCDTISGAGLTE